MTKSLKETILQLTKIFCENKLTNEEVVKLTLIILADIIIENEYKNNLSGSVDATLENLHSLLKKLILGKRENIKRENTDEK